MAARSVDPRELPLTVSARLHVGPEISRQTVEVFGGYSHTYKFSEGVEDGVVLDLVYEARDIDQQLGSEDKVERIFLIIKAQGDY